MNFKEFLNESKKINPEVLQYDSGSPEWILKETRKGDCAVSLDIDADNEIYEFVVKSNGLYFHFSNGKQTKINKQQFEKYVSEHALGYTKL